MATPPATLRMFVGVRLPQRLMSPFGLYVKSLQSRRGLESARWTPVRNLHITLKFIGDVPREKVRELARGISTFAGDLGLCNQGHGRIAFEQVIALPQRRPRVLALEPDVWGQRVLQHDHALIEEACRNAGIAPEARSFKPHMTVARFRHPPRNLDLTLLPKPPSDGFAEPEELIASSLRREGPIYTVLFRAWDDPDEIRV